MTRLKIEIKDYSDSELWHEIKSGNQDFFGLLFKRYYVDLVLFCRNTANVTQELAEDCVQEVFADMWKYKDGISDTIFVKSYLFASVRNRVYKIKKRLRFTIFSVEEENTTVDMNVRKEMFELFDEGLLKKNKLAKIINELPFRQREIIYLCYVNNLTISQASVLLGINYQSAKNLIFRTLQVIRKSFFVFLFYCL